MRGTLIAELTRRRIQMSEVADLLGVHRNSIHNKVYGLCDFTLTEAFKIYDTYFADSGLDLRELFEVTT